MIKSVRGVAVTLNRSPFKQTGNHVFGNSFWQSSFGERGVGDGGYAARF